MFPVNISGKQRKNVGFSHQKEHFVYTWGLTNLLSAFSLQASFKYLTLSDVYSNVLGLFTDISGLHFKKKYCLLGI